METISNIGLKENDLKLLEQAGVKTLFDLFLLPPSRIRLILDIGLIEVNLLFEKISKNIIPKSITALDIYNNKNNNNLNFGCTGLNNLDQILQGGLPTSSLTELCGPGGVGKSQFCFTLSVTCVTPKNYGGWSNINNENNENNIYNVLYIDTERKFVPERLLNIAENRFPEYYNTSNYESICYQNILNNINLISIDTINQFNEIIKTIESLINNNTKLIIIDSIASLYRRDFKQEELTSRQLALISISSKLKTIAEKYNIIILITNQIMSNFDKKNNFNNNNINNNDDNDENNNDNRNLNHSHFNNNQSHSSDLFHERLLPTLGTSWHHCISTRLLLEEIENVNNLGKRKRDENNIRRIKISKSPIAPNQMIIYKINNSGIIEDNEFI